MDKTTAEFRIAEILEALEEKTGQIVRGIDLKYIDISTNVDPNQNLIRVDISLERQPGNLWQTS